MLHYNLAEKHNKLKEDIIESILTSLRDSNLLKGKYVFCDGDMTVIITEDGNESLDFIEWDGDDIVFNTDENKAISLHDLYFEDLLYFYEILEGADFDVLSVLDAYKA